MSVRLFKRQRAIDKEALRGTKTRTDLLLEEEGRKDRREGLDLEGLRQTNRYKRAISTGQEGRNRFDTESLDDRLGQQAAQTDVAQVQAREAIATEQSGIDAINAQNRGTVQKQAIDDATFEQRKAAEQFNASSDKILANIKNLRAQGAEDRVDDTIFEDMAAALGTKIKSMFTLGLSSPDNLISALVEKGEFDEGEVVEVKFSNNNQTMEFIGPDKKVAREEDGDPARYTIGDGLDAKLKQEIEALRQKIGVGVVL